MNFSKNSSRKIGVEDDNHQHHQLIPKDEEVDFPITNIPSLKLKHPQQHPLRTSRSIDSQNNGSISENLLPPEHHFFDLHFHLSHPHHPHHEQLKNSRIKRFETPLCTPKSADEDQQEITAMTMFTRAMILEGKSNSTDEILLIPYVVTGNQKGFVKLWNVNDLEGVRSIEEESKRPIQSLACIEGESGYITIVAGGGGMNTAFVILWDIQKNELSALFSPVTNVHRRGVTALSIVPTAHSTFIIVGSRDRTVSIWSFETRELLHLLPQQHSDILSSLTVLYLPHTNELHLLTGSYDKSVFFWKINLQELEENQLVANPMPYYQVTGGGHRKAITAICVCPIRDGSRELDHPVIFVTGSQDAMVIIWDFETKELIKKLKGHKAGITALTVHVEKSSPLFPKIISSSEDHSIIIWDVATGHMMRTIQYDTKISCCVAFDTSLGMLLVAGGERGAMINNLQKTERVKSIPTDPVTCLNVFTPRIDDPIQDPLLLVSSIDQSCSIYNLRTNRLMNIVKHHTTRINCVVIYIPPEGTKNPLVISCDNQGMIKVWDLFNFAVMNEFSFHTGAVLSLGLYDPVLAWSKHYSKHKEEKRKESAPTSNQIELDLNQPMVIAGGVDGDLSVWKLFSDESKPNPSTVIENAHQSEIKSIVIHHSRRKGEVPWIISGSLDRTVIIRELKNCSVLFKLPTDSIVQMALYDPFAHLGERNTLAVQAISPDFLKYPILITASTNSVVSVWSMNYKDPKSIHQLKGHHDHVTTVAIYVPINSQENPLILSGSMDRKIIVWDLFTGDSLQTLVGHSDHVRFVMTYLPSDGVNPIVLSGSDDKHLIIWEDSLPRKKYLPLRDQINRYFHADCQEEDWPLITELTHHYGAQLFLENRHLFFLAIQKNQLNFLLKFLKYLILVLPYMPKLHHRTNHPHHQNDNEKNTITSDQKKAITQPTEEEGGGGGDLLSYALEQNDLICLRILLYAWTENLNQDNDKNLLLQKIYHPSYFFSYENLIRLAIVHPLEFQNFILGIRLIRNHSSSLMKDLDYDEAYHTYQHEGLTSTGEKSEHSLHRAASAISPSLVLPSQVDSARERKEDFPQSQRLSEKNESPRNYSMKSTKQHSHMIGLTDDHHHNHHHQQHGQQKAQHHHGRRFVTQSLALNSTFRFEITKTIIPTPRYSQLWQKRFESGLYSSLQRWFGTATQSVVSLSIPLGRKTKGQYIHILRIFILVTEQLNCVDIFESEIAIVLLRFIWDQYAFKFHIVSMFIYSSFVALFTASMYLYSIAQNGSDNTMVVAQTLNSITFFFILYYVLEEIYQYYCHFGQFTFGQIVIYFSTNVWNLLNIAVIATGIPGLSLRWVYNYDTTLGRVFLALCSVLIWFRMLYFLRPFSASGPLVTMILQIIYAIRVYLIVLFCVLAGFTQALWLLSSTSTSSMNGYSTVQHGLLRAFYNMLGENLATDEQGTVVPDFTTFVMVIFMMSMMILMLNLLIALMGDTYARVRAKDVAIWRREQAYIIIERFFVLRYYLNGTPYYLHCLKYQSDLNDYHQVNRRVNQILYESVQQCKKVVEPYTELEE